MTFYEKFEELCAANGTSPVRVRKDLGLSQSTVASWKSRSLTPKLETIVTIAGYFGVPVTHLMTNGAPTKPAKTPDDDRSSAPHGFEIKNPNPNQTFRLKQEVWFLNESRGEMQSGYLTHMFVSAEGENLAHVVPTSKDAGVALAILPLDKLFPDAKSLDDEIQTAYTRRVESYVERLPSAETLARALLERYKLAGVKNLDDRAFAEAAKIKLLDFFDNNETKGTDSK